MAQSILSLFGWKIEAEIPNIPQFVLIGAPHTSNVDFFMTMATMYALGVRISWMAKRSLFRWPVNGLLRWLGGVPIDRSTPGRGVVEQTVARFEENEQFAIAIMPAGGRSMYRKWKTGFYRIAEGAGVPILLVKFDYGRKVMGIGPTFEPTGDMEGDIAEMRACYEGVMGRHPDRL
jgi:1-acyl-sn-glycerol-3-phosphate acyltransferase